MTADSELLEKFHDDNELVDALHFLEAVEGEKGVNDDSYVEALLQLGHLLHRRGDFLDALGYFIRGRGVLEAREEQLHPLMSDLLAGMGEHYLLQEMLPEALPYLEKAVSVREALCVAENVETALMLMKTAEIRISQQDFFPAHEQLARAYQILCAAAPENFELLGEACHNLGVLLIAEKHFDRAAESLRRACEFRGKHFGKESLERSDSLVALAAVHKELGDTTEGLHALYEAMTIREDVLGAEHEAVKDVKERYRAMSEELSAGSDAAVMTPQKDTAIHVVDSAMLNALITATAMAVQRDQADIALKLLELSRQVLGNPDEPSRAWLDEIARIIR